MARPKDDRARTLPPALRPSAPVGASTGGELGDGLRLRRRALLAAGSLALACAAVLTACSTAEPHATTALPQGFVDELVARVPVPTDLAFSADGRLYVASQPGILRVIEADRLRPRAALDLTSSVCSERERGLVGITFHPRFASNRLAYVYYTFKKFGTCAVDGIRVPVNRVVRFRVRQDGTFDAESARVLIDNVPSFHAIHNAGDLEFGKDGYLYVSIGDGGRDYARRSDRSFTNEAARDSNVLLGKIARITSDGAPAPNGAGRAAVRCARSGPVDPDLTCAEIYATGLRNPFRIAFDPNATATRFFINDVGEATWEEVNVGAPGADYGWNVREGPCVVLARARCGPPPRSMTEPLLAYGREQGCGSITGGAFVPDKAWPAEYDGTYVFADFLCGRIFIVDSSAEQPAMKTFVSDLPLPSITSMVFGPDRRTLYYATFARGGEVRRIVHRP